MKKNIYLREKKYFFYVKKNIFLHENNLEIGNYR